MAPAVRHLHGSVQFEGGSKLALASILHRFLCDSCFRWAFFRLPFIPQILSVLIGIASGEAALVCVLDSPVRGP